MRAAVERARNLKPPWQFAKARYRLARLLADGRVGPGPAVSELVCEVLGRLFFNDRDEVRTPLARRQTRC
jgi:hypothetical protein